MPKSFLHLARTELPAVGLSMSEIQGFVAEADIDRQGEVSFAEHTKLWIGMVVDLRRDPLLRDVIHRDLTDYIKELALNSEVMETINTLLSPINEMIMKNINSSLGTGTGTGAAASNPRRRGSQGSKTRLQRRDSGNSTSAYLTQLAG